MSSSTRTPLRARALLAALCAGVAVIAATLAAAPTAAAPTGTPTSYREAAAPTTAEDAGRYTTITVKAPSCEGCLLRAWSHGQDWLVTVVDGVASFWVPTAMTKQMIFETGFVVPGEDGSIPGQTVTTGGVPIAVVSYPGMRAGQKVTAAKAARAKRGTGCWAGTTKRHVTLKLNVALFTTTDAYTGEEGKDARLYLGTTLAKTGPYKRLFHGQAGTQDEVSYCASR